MLRSLLLLVLVACETDPAPAATSRAPATQAPDSDAPVSSASRAATRLAEYKEREHRRPADVVAVGLPLRIYEFDVKLERPVLADAETRLPWIANVEERAAFRGKRALIVPFSARNDAPVARELDVGFVLHTSDGKRHTGGVYNERLAAKQRGRTAWYDLQKLAPDKWVDSVLVFDVDPAHLEGAVLYVARWIRVRDRFGRWHSIVEQHAVADLQAPIEGPPIRAK